MFKFVRRMLKPYSVSGEEKSVSNLFIVSASCQRGEPGTVEALQTSISARASGASAGASTLLAPRAVTIDQPRFSETIPYDGEIGLEKNQSVWLPLLERTFDNIFIFGTENISDREEIILSCYLNGKNKKFIDRQGAQDLARWEEIVKPNMLPREIRIKRLSADQKQEHIQNLHRRLATQLADADFKAPAPPERRPPDVNTYRHPRLAIDLAQQTFDLHFEMPGIPFSTFFCPDGSFVQSNDYYRALANFVMAVDGIESVLDVGCGSGFLASYLASSGRYKEVIGVDSSPERINGAQLYSRLNGCSTALQVSSMFDIKLPDRSVDLTVTSFALEQSGTYLERCFSEIVRVTRKLVIMFEPSTEFFSTMSSLWNVTSADFASQYYPTLTKSGLSFAIRPNLLNHYSNPGTVFVVDLRNREHPNLSYPKLFGLGVEDWPGGVRIA
jgi:SAM-dependent methyltransferase/predicted GIY-YIG superfamily endonuclease